MSKTVWIDLENSPHVPFFVPWIAWLREAGYEVLLTARDLSQTHELLKLHGLDFHPVGGHGGGGFFRKATRTLVRAAELARHVRGRGIVLALGHGARAQVVAARWLRIPSVTFLDYEYVSLKLFALLCDKVFFPDSVPAETLVARGVPAKKLVFYPGFKEQVYLDPAVDRRAPVSPPLILIRPPARHAHYHTVLSGDLYRRLVERLARDAAGAQVMFLPRYADDWDELRVLAGRHPHFRLPDGPQRGRDLLLKASLVISGGGTMVREAAVLDVPAASFFGGPVGGVDRALSEMGRLTLMRAAEDVERLALPGAAPAGSPRREAAGPIEAAPPPAPPKPLPDSAAVRAHLHAAIAEMLGRG